MTRGTNENPLLEILIIAIFLIMAGPILAPYVGMNLTVIGWALLGIVVLTAVVVGGVMIQQALSGLP